MKKAPPANAIKLTDPNEYDRIEYKEFFSCLSSLDLTSEQKVKFETLQEDMRYLRLNQTYREDKLYVYFILKLQEILYDSNRT